MYDTLRMQVGQSFEDLDDVARYEALRQLAELLERPLQRAILHEPIQDQSVSKGRRISKWLCKGTTHSRMMLR